MYRQKTFLCKIENQNKTSAISPPYTIPEHNANALPDDTDAAAPSFPELEISHRGHNVDDA